MTDDQKADQDVVAPHVEDELDEEDLEAVGGGMQANFNVTMGEAGIGGAG